MHIRKRNDADATNSLPPRPMVVKTSGDFDGNDGKWSTFSINVGGDGKGGHGQNFKVLVSTSSPLIQLPQQAEWCTEECAKSRGVESFEGKQPRGLVTSNNWEQFGLYEIPMPYWYSRDFLGKRNDTPAATWGIQNVALGENSPQAQVIASQWVVGQRSKDFYLGSFGLAAGATGTAGVVKKNFFTELEAAKPRLFASSSYGYTAGAMYRNNGRGVPGNLVLGGYDKSRLTDTGISIQMPSSSNTTLAVGVISIASESQPGIEDSIHGFTLGGFDASIDSTFPYLVLPDNICDEFVKIFGLDFDEDRKIYIVNSTSHSMNKRKNATITFKLGESHLESLKFTNIVLPYSAFDLDFSDPDGSASQRYFPIKKSENNIYVLGRTFLQEAYIIVDYERENFTVAPAYYGDPKPPENLITILSPNFRPPSAISEVSGGGLPYGAVAGIVVAIVVVSIVAGITSFCFWKKRKNANHDAHDHGETSAIDTALADDQIKRRRVSELTGSEIITSPKSPLQDYWSVDHKSIPPISEMSPDSPPVELYSPPPESASDRDSRDYFSAGQARRHNSGRNTPGTPAIAELPGDEGQFYTPGTQFEAVIPLQGLLQTRKGPSDTSLKTNIDERLADSKKSTKDPDSVDDTKEAIDVDERQSDPASAERRPSHTRGLSETTVQSDTTAVSQPTPEEEERWAREPRRPLSD